MWKAQRVMLTIHVELDLDAIPSAFHTEQGAKEAVGDILRHALNDSVPHSKPIVT